MDDSEQKIFPRLSFFLLLSWLALPALFLPLASGGEEGKGEQIRRRGEVTAGILNIRSRPGQNYEVVGKLRRGEEVNILERTEEWLGIRPPDDVESWCASEYLGDDGEVKADSLRVRSGPGIMFSPIAEVSRGDKVKLAGNEKNGWRRIKPPENAVVWVHSDYIKVPEPDEAGVDAEMLAGLDEEERELVTMSMDAEKLLQPDMDALRKLARDKREAETVEGEEGQAVETAEELAARKDVEEEETDAEEVPRNGLLIPLPESSAVKATHALAELSDNGRSAYPQVLLYSDRIDFTPWHYRMVQVYGDITDERARERPVIFVTGIKLLNP